MSVKIDYWSKDNVVVVDIVAIDGDDWTLIAQSKCEKRWLDSDNDVVVLMLMMMVMVVTRLLLHRAQRDDLAGCTECVSTGCTPS